MSTLLYRMRSVGQRFLSSNEGHIRTVAIKAKRTADTHMIYGCQPHVLFVVA